MVNFSSARLLRKKQFQSLSGVTPDQFHRMVNLLRADWRQRIVGVKNRDGRPYGVGGLEDHLLILLIIYRCHITQDFLACLYGVDKSDDLPKPEADREADAAGSGGIEADQSHGRRSASLDPRLH
jgi:hypothetical protein